MELKHARSLKLDNCKRSEPQVLGSALMQEGSGCNTSDLRRSLMPS